MDNVCSHVRHEGCVVYHWSGCLLCRGILLAQRKAAGEVLSEVEEMLIADAHHAGYRSCSAEETAMRKAYVLEALK